MSNQHLDPNLSPSGINSTTQINSGVKQLNRLPIVIISIVLMILILGLGYATLKRTQLNQSKEEQQGKTRQDGEQLATNFIDRLYHDTSPSQKETNNTKPLPQPLVKTSPTALIQNESPLMMTTAAHQTDQADREHQKALQRYKEELYKTALTSPSTVKINTAASMPNSTPNAPLSPMLPPNPADIYNQVLQAYQTTHGQAAPTQTDNERFLANQQNSYDYLAAKKTEPISPYEIKTGTLIPSVLMTAINSDLPGPIKAQVRENVFDTATGNYLLIPQGSTLVGVYSSRVAYGQNRVLIAFNRLIFPDGATLNIGGMNGVDQSGAAGFHDQVNNHYLRIFGSALLLGGITGGIAANDDTSRYQMMQTPKQTMISSIINELGQVAKEMIHQNMNIAPTLEIRPGYRFNVFATKDKYQPKTNFKSLLKYGL